jgi:beta-lactamase superfamily II metal-dependent hydrolase
MGKAYFCNVGCADCTVIQASSGTYLIDCFGIENHANLLPSSKRLRGVFITHQHRDHFGGLNYLKDNGYAIDFLIYSPYERRYSDNSVEYDEWQEFNGLCDYFVTRGTQKRTPYRQTDFKERFWAAGEVDFEILAPFEDLAKSDTRELHDACLVVGVYAGKRRFLVCGDASDASLNKLAKNTTNYCNDLLRCSHHASIDGADLDFVKRANAEWTVISTACGMHDNVPHPTVLARYRENTKQKVFRTDTDGTVSAEF